MKKKHLIIFIIIANAILIPTVIIPGIKKTIEDREKRWNQFTDITKKDSTQVSGILYTKSMENNYCFISLKNGEKWGIAFAYNDDYEPDDYMYDFIQPGDSLFKASGSDTMHIYRNDDHYYFVLYQRINK
jgi:hypothetical protein